MALHKLHEARHVLLPNDEESFCVDCRLKKRLLINPDKATPTPNDSNFKQGPSSKTKVIKVALLSQQTIATQCSHLSLHSDG